MVEGGGTGSSLDSRGASGAAVSGEGMGKRSTEASVKKGVG